MTRSEAIQAGIDAAHEAHAGWDRAEPVGTVYQRASVALNERLRAAGVVPGRRGGVDKWREARDIFRTAMYDHFGFYFLEPSR